MTTAQFSTLPRRTKSYIALIVVAGAATVLQSTYSLLVEPIGWDWTILAILTLVSGSATVRLPSLPATISVSETFVFTSTLLFGPAAGTLTVALDALVISFWSYKKGHPLFKIIFNVCALPLTIWIAAQIFFILAGVEPLATIHGSGTVPIRDLVLPLLAFTVVYFSLNSWIITFAIALEKQLPAFPIWRDNFVWLSLNYFGGASVAALLVSYRHELDYTYLAVILPLLIVLYFTYSTSMGRVEDANRHLTQLNSLYMSTIETLAMAIDAKDQITHGHIRRVQSYAVSLAKAMGVTDVSLIRAVEAAALLHDMGKLAVPEYILNKPGALTPAEFEKMKLHASVGADILSAIDFPYPVVPIVRHHHEAWNGNGYPEGLSGTDIPIGARILSVVDCFDALTSDRPYRPRLSDKEAIKVLQERRGTMYDPLVVDVFVRVHAQIAPAPLGSRQHLPLRAITDASTALSMTPAPASRFDEITASTEETLTLFDLAQGLTSQMGVHAVGDVIHKHLRRLVPFSLSAFFAYDVERDDLLNAHASGDNSSLVIGLRIGLGERLSGWVAANQQTIRNSDPVLDLGDAARTMAPRLRSCLSTPLTVESELLGVLTLYSTARDGFSEEHQRIIEAIARQVSQILKNALDFDRSGAAEARHSFAGLPQVEHIRSVASALTGEERLPRLTALLLIRVQVVQERSHPEQVTSEDALAGIVKIVRSTIRPIDLLFAFGTDRLVVLLLQAGHTLAGDIATQLDSALERTREVPGQRVRTSMAVVGSPIEGSTVDELLQAAACKLSAKDARANARPGTPSGSIH
jgi:putative nucleotidyltransferase with HDIG domain